MDIRTPPPPSPSASEPPPSYDSLTPAPMSHVQLPTAPGQQLLQPAPLSTIEELPPPYSPGLQTICTVDTPQDEGSNVPSLSAVREAPPSYNSLFGQIQNARLQTRGKISFLKRLCQIVIGTVGCTFLLVLLMFVSLTVMVIGLVYLEDCPLQPRLPTFLIIGGLSGLLKSILLLIENIVKKNSAAISSRIRHSQTIIGIWNVTNLVFNIFTLCWVIAGSYWIYSIYQGTTSDGYANCNITLYKFSFSSVTCSYVLLVLVFAWNLFLAGESLRRRKRQATSSDEGEDGIPVGSGGELAGAEELGNATSEDAEGEGVNAIVLEEVELEGVSNERVELVDVDTVSNQERVNFEGVVSHGRVEPGGVVSDERELHGVASNEMEGVERAGLGCVASNEMEGVELGGVTSVEDQHIFERANSFSASVVRDDHRVSCSFPHHDPSESTATLASHSSQLSGSPRVSRSRHSSLRYESSPSFHQSFRQGDFGSGLIPSRSKHMRGAVSYLQLQNHMQKNLTRPSSNPALHGSHSNTLDSRRLFGRHTVHTTRGRSSLYNTFLSDGFSITAV